MNELDEIEKRLNKITDFLARIPLNVGQGYRSDMEYLLSSCRRLISQNRIYKTVTRQVIHEMANENSLQKKAQWVAFLEAAIVSGEYLEKAMSVQKTEDIKT